MEKLEAALGGMRSLAQWFLWRLEPGTNGKYEKTPCALDGSPYRVDASKPENWHSYTDARQAWQSLPRGHYVLGFWMTPGCGYWFLDLDNAAGNEWATKLVGCYPGALVEWSSSGKGLHVIGKHTGSVPDHRTRPTANVAAQLKPLGLEFYTQGRGIAFGIVDAVQGSADAVFDVRPLVDAYFKREPSPLPIGIRAEWRGPADDDALIERMLSARQSAAAALGGKASLRDLWAGNCELNSEHDMALASHLAFWTGCDEPRIERLMRRSQLVREKWNESRPGGTYLTYTIRNACAGTMNVYQEPVRAVQPSAATGVRSASDLLKQRFKPVEWAVHGIIPEGVTILSGDPKIGKSWLVYQMCIAVAAGIPLWRGRQPEQVGETLYLSLEDNERRLKRRLEQLLRGFPMNLSADQMKRLHYTTQWPRAEDGVSHLASWLREHPQCRLVVVDTVSAFRETDPGRKSAYAHDYAVGEMFKPLAREFSCAIVLVMHNRKQTAGDVMHKVSGTQGMTGGVDNVLILERGRGDMDAALHVDGRDIEDPTQLAMRFENGSWVSLGRLSDVQRSKERSAVFEAITTLGGSCTVKELHAVMGDKTNAAIRKMLSRMVKSGELENCGAGIYTLPHQAVPLSSLPLPTNLRGA